MKLEVTSLMKLISCCDNIYHTPWSQIECLKYLETSGYFSLKKLKQKESKSGRRETNIESG